MISSISFISILASLFSLFTEAEPKPKYKLVWSDEFNKDGAPDSTSWNYDLGHGYDGWGNHELQSYTKLAENVIVKDGKLVIKAIKRDGEWTSARLKTHGKQSWTYGKFEFRAKLPAGKGTWPALWMLGDNITKDGWPVCGEIDIMEHVGKNPTVVQSALHTPASHGETINKNSTVIKTFDSEFHTYEAVWTPDQIEFFADGISYYVFSPSMKDDKTWPFDSPFYLLINLAIGGGFGGEVEPSLEQAQLEVDYVRVYTDSKTKR